jgi:Cdc6-like AAA superfamily ATPase
LASVYPTIRRENLSYLHVDERLILLASARALSGNRTSITSKELYQFYRVVCEEMGFDPYGYTFYREKLQHLQDLGYLRLSIKSSNKKGRRTYITYREYRQHYWRKNLSRASAKNTQHRH